MISDPHSLLDEDRRLGISKLVAVTWNKSGYSYQGRGPDISHYRKIGQSRQAGDRGLRRRWFYDEQPGDGNSRSPGPACHCAGVEG